MIRHTRSHPRAFPGRDRQLEVLLMSTFPVLHTQRLTLREIVPSDADALCAIHDPSERMKLFGADPLPDRAAAEKLVSVFASWRELPNPGIRWGIDITGQPGLVGTCGLFMWHRAYKRCTIGYELSSSVEGRGYMHEALCAVIEWGWREMDLNRIEAGVHPDNAGSLKVLRRLGFQQEGLARQLGFWRGAFHDMFQLALLRQDWPPAGAG